MMAHSQYSAQYLFAFAHFAGPIDLDGELAEPEQWKTLFGQIYGYFIQNPVFEPLDCWR